LSERVTAVVVGAGHPEHLDPALRALELRLDDAALAELDAL